MARFGMLPRSSNHLDPTPQKRASRVAGSRPRMRAATSSRLTARSGRLSSLAMRRRVAATSLRAVDDRQRGQASDASAAVGSLAVDGGHVHGVDAARGRLRSALNQPLRGGGQDVGAQLALVPGQSLHALAERREPVGASLDVAHRRPISLKLQ